MASPPGSPDFVRRMRARSGQPPQGRWSLIGQHVATPVSVTQWSANVARQLLVRHGIVLRETAIAENIKGGYPPIYPALKTMEDSGWVRRGMFVAGLGAAQFAVPAAVDMLRSLRADQRNGDEVLYIAATDPANLYGTILPWPRTEDGISDAAGEDDQSGESADTATSHSMSRTSGAGVILINGNLVAFLRRRNQDVQVFLPEADPDRTHFARELSKKLAELAIKRQGRRSGLLIGTINGKPSQEHFLSRFLEQSGFVNTALGFQMRRVVAVPIKSEKTDSDLDSDENDLDVEESA